MSNQKSLFVHGDQFVGMNVNPNSGDLVLRFFFIVGDKTDGNGRGVTSESIAETRRANIGRPLIYAPNESQGGTKGHTSFLSKNAYDYEIGKIINIEPATKNLIQRIKKSMMQSSSSYGFDYNLYNKLLEQEKNVWVTDIHITNETAKKIWLNPTTTHLIPRYVSPSIIHPRNPRGDYSKVNKWVLDHIAIVDKPVFDMDGRQIAGAAYGEDARLRGACFGDKLVCLDVLQTSSSLEKCVSCPTQLVERLSILFHNTMKKHSYLLQSSSSSDVSTDNSSQATTSDSKPANTNTANTNANVSPLASLTTPDQQNTFVQQSGAGDGGGSQFVPDTKALTDYANFGKVVGQWIQENKNEVRQLLDAEKPFGQEPQQTPQPQQQTQEGQPPLPNKPEPIPAIDVKSLLEKFNITEEQLKKMEAKEIATKFGEIKNSLESIAKISNKNALTLADLQKKEEIQVIESMIPKETFSDNRGFNKKDYDDLVDYIHGKQLRKDIITLIGVGLITLKKQQHELASQQKDLKSEKASQFFGQTLKQLDQNLKQQGQPQIPQQSPAQ